MYIAPLTPHLLIPSLTSRNGGQALLSLVRPVGTKEDIVITPDGPRGSALFLRAGAILLAKNRCGHRSYAREIFRSVRLKSRDGLILPMPCSTTTMTVGGKITVPPEASGKVYRLAGFSTRRDRYLVDRRSEAGRSKLVEAM